MTEAAEVARPSPGQMLKALREDRGIGQGTVAESLHLTVHYVNALENDDYDRLPGRTFIKGYLKSYAKYLKEEPEQILACYEDFVSAVTASEQSEEQEIRARKSHDQNIRWLIVASIIIVIVLGASWWFQRPGASSPVTTVVSPARNAARPVPQPSAAESTAQDTLSQPEAPTSLQTLAPGANGDELAEPVADTPDETVTNEPEADVPDEGEPEADSPSADVLSVPDSPQTENTDDPAVATGPGGTEPGVSSTVLENAVGARNIRLESSGDDLLRMRFNGNSWVEVDNARDIRLYNDTLYSGDELIIQGEAPFDVLLGNAWMLDELVINARQVDFSSNIRSDNTARVLLEP
ncbi:MAG: DUF4115 domain-containing protein [Pseudomonadales bacterium]|nr:DUF4115 domain-containing protein [Pseudomonadales bacterium]